MKDRTGQDTGQKKKPYVKPKITRVELKPEEAVLGGCKIAGISGPYQASCTTLSCSSIIS
jgi:hypothetical protein